MKLVLPTNKQAVIFVKYSLILGLFAALLSWLVLKQDPLLTKSEEFINNNQKVINLIGEERKSRLVKATYVDDAIDYEDNFTPGYNLYRYKIIGTTGTIIATVRADKTNNTEYVFSIKNITEN